MYAHTHTAKELRRQFSQAYFRNTSRFVYWSLPQTGGLPTHETALCRAGGRRRPSCSDYNPINWNRLLMALFAAGREYSRPISHTSIPSGPAPTPPPCHLFPGAISLKWAPLHTRCLTLTVPISTLVRYGWLFGMKYRLLHRVAVKARAGRIFNDAARSQSRWLNRSRGRSRYPSQLNIALPGLSACWLKQNTNPDPITPGALKQGTFRPNSSRDFMRTAIHWGALLKTTYLLGHFFFLFAFAPPAETLKWRKIDC